MASEANALSPELREREYESTGPSEPVFRWRQESANYHGETAAAAVRLNVERPFGREIRILPDEESL